MATVDLSRVLALLGKARAVQLERRFSLSVDYLFAAVEAARALQQPEDSFILACTNTRYACAIVVHADTADLQVAEQLTLTRKALSIFDSVAPVLRSHRVTGTLSLASMQPVEVAFAVAYSKILYETNLDGPDERLGVATLVYAHYLIIAESMLYTQAELLAELGERALEMPEFSRERLRARYDFAASALDFMAEPKGFSIEEGCMEAECGMIERVCVLKLTGREQRSLADAWKRLQRSGFLRK